MTAPPDVVELVVRLRRNVDLYKRDDYKETRVRVEFVDPFFEALGWDVRNVQGYAEQYKDVVHEDAVKVSGATRAPDYCFRVGGTASIPADKTLYQRPIDATDAQIDALVYELYGLSEEEIRIVEESG